MANWALIGPTNPASLEEAEHQAEPAGGCPSMHQLVSSCHAINSERSAPVKGKLVMGAMLFFGLKNPELKKHTLLLMS